MQSGSTFVQVLNLDNVHKVPNFCHRSSRGIIWHVLCIYLRLVVQILKKSSLFLWVFEVACKCFASYDWKDSSRDPKFLFDILFLKVACNRLPEWIAVHKCVCVCVLTYLCVCISRKMQVGMNQNALKRNYYNISWSSHSIFCSITKAVPSNMTWQWPG